MRFAGIGAPEKNKVRLRHFLIRTGGPARAEDRRQTGDAGGVSSPVAAVNVVAPDDRTDEFLRDVIQLVGCFRAAEHAESARPVFFDLAAQPGGDEIEGFLPTCRPVTVSLANQRSGEPGGGNRGHLKLPPECAAESLGLRNRTKVVALGRPCNLRIPQHLDGIEKHGVATTAHEAKCAAGEAGRDSYASAGDSNPAQEKQAAKIAIVH
jgi:hypothetical protein